MANKIVQKSANNSDMRQIAISKTLEIGKSGQNTTVSDQEIRTNKIFVSDNAGEKIDLFEYVNENVTRLDGEVETLDSRIEYLDNLIDKGKVEVDNDGLVTGDKIHEAIEDAKKDAKIEIIRGKGIRVIPDITDPDTNTNTNTYKISLATDEILCDGIWVSYDDKDDVYFRLNRSSVDDLGGVILYDGVDNGVSEKGPNGFNNITSDADEVVSDARAATPKAVKTAYDKAVEAHETAISATTTVGENDNGLSISRDADGTIIEMATATEENHGTVKLHKGEVESDDTGDSVTTVTSISETRKALEDSISKTNDRLAKTNETLDGLLQRPLVNVKVVTSEEWEEIKLNNQLETNTLYLVGDGDQATSGNYVEYMTYTDNNITVVEQIGTTKLDIDDYVTNDELDTTVKELNESIDDVKLYVGNDTNFTNKINFLGAYVNVVRDSNGETNVYIGENNNNPSFKNATDTLDDAKYIFASSTSKWYLPANVSGSPTSTYACTSSLTGSETVTFKNAAGGEQIGNILADSVIIVTVTSDKGETTYTTGKISEAAQAGTSKTWEDTAKGIKVAASSLKYYTSADAEAGFTPGSTTGKFTVTLDNDKLVGANGGWYYVKVEMGGVSDTSSTVFVYDGQKVTPSVGTPTITYEAGTERYVSGLVYDSSGIFTLFVPSIANTQYAMTTTKNRLKVTGTFEKTVAYGDSGLELYLGDKYDEKNETAVFSYTATNSPTATSATKATASATVQAYGQSAVGGDAKSASTTATSWLYTSTDADTDMACKFCTDGMRVYNVLSDITGGATINTYDNEANLDDTYTSQLLVQDGKLRYPTLDNTKRYSSTFSNTRYYVRPINFTGSGDQISTISVDVAEGMESAFNNGAIRLYLAKKGVADPMVLNCYSKDVITYGKPIGDPQKPTSGAWTCTINNDVFQLYGNTADTYYLVVEMLSAATIGAITLAKVK